MDRAQMVLLAWVGWAAGWASAATLNVDLQPGPSGATYSANYAGQGGLADPGHDTWNAVAPPVAGYASSWGSGGNYAFTGTFTSEPLFDSAGVPTPVTVSISIETPLGTTFAVNPDNTWAYEHVATDVKHLMSDYLIAPGNGTNSLVINHLVPGAKYTLCLYGAGDQNTHQTTFTVGGVSQTTKGAPHEVHVMAEGGEYVVFSEVEAVNGSLVIQYTGAGLSRDGNFNGFQLRGEWPAPPVAAPAGAEEQAAP